MELTEKYRPKVLADFAGVDQQVSIFRKLATSPWESAWLLVGQSGTGKTTMALALSSEMGGELHHIPSRECDLDTVKSVVDKCWYVPMNGGWHIVLVDEADQMSRAAQLAFLSKLDSTAKPPRTIFIFTANDTKLLEDRFLSRCRILTFTEQASGAAAQAKLLAQIWKAEGGRKPAPNFAGILRAAGYNVRAAMMNLELELLVPGAGCTTEKLKAACPRRPEPIALDDRTAIRRAAARKAWETMRARRAAGGR